MNYNRIVFIYFLLMFAALVVVFLLNFFPFPVWVIRLLQLIVLFLAYSLEIGKVEE